MSITDGSVVCGLCGESRTGCGLCGVAPLIDRRAALAHEAAAEIRAERELDAQERSIRRSAHLRRMNP